MGKIGKKAYCKIAKKVRIRVKLAKYIQLNISTKNSKLKVKECVQQKPDVCRNLNT